MTIKGFQLTHSGMTPLDTSASTLDEMTRGLPQGYYTTFSTMNCGMRVLGLQVHLNRLYIPAKETRLHPGVGEGRLRQHIAELVKENLPHESRLRLILTKDTGDIFIGIQPFVPLPESVYENGVHVITANLARHDPRIKDTGFITESIAERKLINKDVFEVLLTKDGKILEGMTSNFYVIKHVIASGADGRVAEGVSRPSATKQSQPSSRRLFRAEDRRPRNDIKLITARHGILLGVTRRAVLRLARGEGMSIEYRAPHVDEEFNEAFLTSSSRGVVPIVMIDDKLVGEGRVGTCTKTLSLAYQAYVEERSERIV
jgi:branched-chain amino acid aminotransferase